MFISFNYFLNPCDFTSLSLTIRDRWSMKDFIFLKFSNPTLFYKWLEESHTILMLLSSFYYNRQSIFLHIVIKWCSKHLFLVGFNKFSALTITHLLLWLFHITSYILVQKIFHGQREYFFLSFFTFNRGIIVALAFIVAKIYL